MRFYLLALLVLLPSVAIAQLRGPTVRSVAGRSGVVTLEKADVGLSAAVEVVYGSFTFTQDYVMDDVVDTGLTIPANARVIALNMGQEGVDCSAGAIYFGVDVAPTIFGTVTPPGGVNPMPTSGSATLVKYGTAKNLKMKFAGGSFGCADDVEKFHFSIMFIQE